MARYRFWLRLVDRTILKIADGIGPDPARYRQEEVDCESASNAMLQSAMEATSQTTRNSRIESPPGYLTPVYKRIVDKFLARKQRVVPVGDSFVEDLTNTEEPESFEDTIHNRLVVEKILNAMDPDTRRICQWRLQGYSMREIAKELNITPNCLSVRYTRGVKKAASEAMRKKRD